MAGAIRRMIDQLVEERSRGNEVAAATVRVKLLLKGIDSDRYTITSEDDPVVIERLQQMRAEFETQGGSR